MVSGDCVVDCGVFIGREGRVRETESLWGSVLEIIYMPPGRAVPLNCAYLL